MRKRLALLLPVLAVSCFAIPLPAYGIEEADVLIETVREPWIGDLDGMYERRSIRVLVPYSKTFFFLDEGTVRGLAVESLREFQKYLDKTQKKKEPSLIKLIPTARDALLSDLVAGRGDIAVGNLTITPARKELVDFSDAVLTGVREYVVTAETEQAITQLADLAGREVHVRKSSSYFESLVAANGTLEAAKLDPIKIVEADERLEDEDLIDMVQAGLLPAIVVDSHKAAFWKQVFPHITVHEGLALREDGEIGWAFRKESPLLAEAINGFAKQAGEGTSVGNTLLRRYFKNTKWLKAANGPESRKRMAELRELFEKYGDQYEIDWLLVAAQSYQESNFDQGRRNPSGAVGLMQIKPTTAADPNVGIKDITTNADNNVHAGVKYLRFIADQYFDGQGLDDTNRIFLALAAYNAGPNRVARERGKAKNPNIWFGEVEWAVAKRTGIEPVKYVSNILKYYIFFKRVIDNQDAEAAK